MSRQTAIQTTKSNDIQVNSCCAPETPAQQSPAHSWSYIPAMDVIELPSEYEVIFDAPGIDANHIDLTYESGTLTLHAPVQQRYSQQMRYLRQEYGVGDFDRAIPLGRLAELVDGDRINATYEHGVLTVHLPKLERSQGRRIEVKAL